MADIFELKSKNQIFDQERFNAKMEDTIDIAYQANVPQDEADEILRQWKGGKCPVCHKEYKKTHTKNVTADFEWFEPQCECFADKTEKEETAKKRMAKMQQANIPKKLLNCNFENWDYDVQKITNESMKNVQKYHREEFFNFTLGCVLYGDIGTGKTRCMVSLLWETTKTDLTFRFIPMAGLIGQFIDKQKGEDAIDKIAKYDVVAFDDLDKIYTKKGTQEWIRERVFLLFDRMINEDKLIFTTTNFTTPAEFTEKFGEAIMSRLIGSCRLIKFEGEDYRQKQKSEIEGSI